MRADISVIQKQRRAACGTPRTIAGLERFAGRITHAYLPSRLMVSRADLALAYGAPEQIHNSRHTRIEIAPSIHIHDHSSFHAAPNQSLAVRHAGPRFGESEAAALFDRLFSRRNRDAAFPSDAPPSPATPGRPIKMRPMMADLPMHGPEGVERILRSRTPEPVESVERKARAPRIAEADAGWGAPLAQPAAPRPFTLPPAEVKRVTDEVIREIDHRIIARRERFGRR